MKELISNGGDCRIAPATPGLIIINEAERCDIGLSLPAKTRLQQKERKLEECMTILI